MGVHVIGQAGLLVPQQIISIQFANDLNSRVGAPCSGIICCMMIQCEVDVCPKCRAYGLRLAAFVRDDLSNGCLNGAFLSPKSRRKLDGGKSLVDIMLNLVYGFLDRQNGSIRAGIQANALLGQTTEQFIDW